LHENIKHISVSVDCAPQPMFLATDREYYLVKVPLVVRSWSVTPDAIREIPTKAVNCHIPGGNTAVF